MAERPDWVYVVTLRVGPTDRVLPFGRALASVIGTLLRAGHDVRLTIDRRDAAVDLRDDPRRQTI